MFDAHAHVNFRDFKEDYDETIKRAQQKGVSMINIGSQFSTSERAVDLGEKYDNCFSAVGLHPFHVVEREVEEEVDEHETIKIKSRAEKFDYEKYKKLALSSNNVVAIGECGLDYHYTTEDKLPEEKKLQQEVLNQQIDLANELDLPMIIHCRDGQDDLVSILRNNPLKKLGEAHFFSGNLDQAKELIEMGYYIGFTGTITFKNRVETVLEILKKMSLDRIISETDCPYVAPVPMRGQRNEPAYVEYVVKKIAEVRGISFEEAEKITEENARRLFNVK
ncbi:TatD family hydrolase [Candidatus Falkowbacteria bacterium]|jgi:TatD DNase family protein|nr:TatD family hydrolase [Candidatus Falkowbacteria bacterium]MBT7007810.1 TatD family hydrolase [Candidatus Falkowbacteria bacterium]